MRDSVQLHLQASIMRMRDCTTTTLGQVFCDPTRIAVHTARIFVEGDTVMVLSSNHRQSETTMAMQLQVTAQHLV